LLAQGLAVGAAASYCDYAEIGHRPTASPCGERECLHTLNTNTTEVGQSALDFVLCTRFLVDLLPIEFARAGNDGGRFVRVWHHEAPGISRPGRHIPKSKKHFLIKSQLLKF
jgi:hypothetical protein